MKKLTYLLTYLLLTVSASAGINWGELWTMEEAKSFAQLKVDVYGNSSESDIFANWIGAEVGEATLIYDSTGFPVLYEVEILNGNDNVGTMEIWADKALGTPYSGIKLSKTTELTAKLPIRNNDKPAEKVVYYNYPQKAYKIKVETPNRSTEKTILLDINTQKIVAKEDQQPFKDLIKEENITTTWEYWAELLNDYKMYRIPPGETIETEVLNVTHYRQPITKPWCVGASAQMILDYYNDEVLSQYELLNCYFISPFETTCTGEGLSRVVPTNVISGWNRLGYINTTRTVGSIPIYVLMSEINNGYPLMLPAGSGDNEIHMRVGTGYIKSISFSEAILHDPMYDINSNDAIQLISLPDIYMPAYYKIH